MGQYRTEIFKDAIKQIKPTGCPYCAKDEKVFEFHEDLRDHIESDHKDRIELMLQSMTSVHLERLGKKCNPKRWAAGYMSRMVRDLPRKGRN